MKIKRDHIFVIVLGLILANLTYYFAGAITFLPSNIRSPLHWSITIVNGIGIFGTLWLLRTYRRAIKEAKESKEIKSENP